MTSILLHLRLPSFGIYIHNATVTARIAAIADEQWCYTVFKSAGFFIVFIVYFYLCVSMYICVCVLCICDVSFICLMDPCGLIPIKLDAGM